ncbi:MAG: twin-arginine translocase TatA/TatE family subunit [Actinomyces bowdenii]|nr:twin-arginine translocase TatA/TatE family subunit [Actinomyces bowdenii]
MFGISGSEFLVIMLVAVVVVGPQRLPEYTRQLTRMVRQLRLFLDSARSQIAEEVGPELADLDLSSLDPRQYDPRRIVRDALGEDIEAIRKDLTQPFRSVADAAKETSDAAAKAVGDAVAQDRANSLSNQISQKKAEALKAADSAAEAEPAAEEDESAAGSAAEAATDSADSAAEAEPAAAAEADSATSPEPALDEPSSAMEQPDAAAEPIASVESAESAEPAEPAESAAGQGGAEQNDSVPAEGQDEARKEAAQEDDPQEKTAPAPVVPTSLVESGAQGAESGDATAEHGPQSAGVARPLSPRDIVRAANSAARTRAEAASATVES